MLPKLHRSAGLRLVALLAVLGCRPSDAAPRPAASILPPPSPALPSAADIVPPRPSASAAQATDCPPDMARVAGFCMDRYEAHLARLGEDGTLTPHPPYQRPE